MLNTNPGWDPEDRRAFFANKEAQRLERQKRHELAMAEDKAKREAAVMKPRKPRQSNFTTQYACDWGKRQGWKQLAREGYSHLLKRHKDLMLGTDVLFDDLVSGMVAIQGAGRNERAHHRERFESQGGEETARRLKIRVLYLEFRRGDAEPVKFEEWA